MLQLVGVIDSKWETEFLKSVLPYKWRYIKTSQSDVTSGCRKTFPSPEEIWQEKKKEFLDKLSCLIKEVKITGADMYIYTYINIYIHMYKWWNWACYGQQNCQIIASKDAKRYYRKK